jgi:hypothetical protein
MNIYDGFHRTELYFDNFGVCNEIKFVCSGRSFLHCHYYLSLFVFVQQIGITAKLCGFVQFLLARKTKWRRKPLFATHCNTRAILNICVMSFNYNLYLYPNYSSYFNNRIVIGKDDDISLFQWNFVAYVLFEFVGKNENWFFFNGRELLKEKLNYNVAKITIC